MKKAARITALATLIVGIILFAISSFRPAGADPTIGSGDYIAELEVHAIGVSLMENGKRLSWRDYANQSWDESKDSALFTYNDLLKNENTEIRIGQEYPEVLSVKNSGRIDSYVRVSIYRYWTDQTGNKRNDLDPSLIQLVLNEDENWILDTEASTAERTVLYYALPLKGSDSESGAETSSAFMNAFKVDPQVKTFIEQTETVDKIFEVETEEGKKTVRYTTVVNTYTYDNKKVGLEVEVDAVQTHSAADAIKSCWGKTAVIDGNGKITQLN